MIRPLIALSTLMIALPSLAAPRCLDLTKAQADRAVTIARVALYKDAPLILDAKQESGLVKPRGIWAEKKKNSKFYRVRVDGREMDISLVYVARSANESRAYNLAWMAGCRPAPQKALSIQNWQAGIFRPTPAVAVKAPVVAAAPTIVAPPSRGLTPAIEKAQSQKPAETTPVIKPAAK